MIAIFILKRTIYDCNPFQKGPNMTAIIEILFSRDSSRNYSHVIQGRISTLQSILVLFQKDCNFIQSESAFRLQSYLVPFLIKIAIIFGPHHENYCNHKWSTPIMIFQGSRLLLRDWDLWGPLLLCMVVGTILHEGEGGPHFTQFFILFWVGSAVITLNTKLLGGSISFFQSVSHTV